MFREFLPALLALLAVTLTFTLIVISERHTSRNENHVMDFQVQEEGSPRTARYKKQMNGVSHKESKMDRIITLVFILGFVLALSTMVLAFFGPATLQDILLVVASGIILVVIMLFALALWLRRLLARERHEVTVELEQTLMDHEYRLFHKLDGGSEHSEAKDEEKE